jgi:hypothetical protein
MTNTSANSAGPLAPLSSVGDYDAAYVAFLQAFVVGLTALDPTLVRPRWQLSPPLQPDFSVDWASIGLLSETLSAQRADIHHDPDGAVNAPGDGTDIVERTMRDRIMMSFYGPNAWATAGFFVDGLAIEQNRWALQGASIALREIGPRLGVPELVNDQWLPRVDLTITFDRVVQRTYPVMNLLSAHGTLIVAQTGNPTNVADTSFDTLDYFGA